MEADQIKARVIIEMLGAPRDHIEKTLKDYVETLKDQKGFKIVKVDFGEPEKQGVFFSVFAELEMEFKKPDDLIGFCFDSMPASVEIFEPDELALSCQDFSGLLNDLQGRLHQIEGVVKRLSAKNQLLDANSLEIMRNFIQFAIRQGKQTVFELGSVLGIVDKDLKPFLDRMVEERILKFQGEKYTLQHD